MEDGDRNLKLINSVCSLLPEEIILKTDSITRTLYFGECKTVSEVRDYVLLSKELGLFEQRMDLETITKYPHEVHKSIKKVK